MFGNKNAGSKRIRFWKYREALEKYQRSMVKWDI